MSASVLVTGGTGTLGRALVDRLRAAGTEPMVLSRRSGPGRIVGDLRSGAGVTVAVRQADVIVHAATSSRGDSDLTRTLLEAARRTGRDPHLVFVSIVGIDRIPLPYYREKLRAEALVMGSGLPWTIQRATQFHDLIGGLVRTLSRSPVVPVLSGIRFQPIDVRDVADRLIELCRSPADRRAPDLGGPEVRSMQDLAGVWLSARRMRRAMVTVRPRGAVARAFQDGLNLTPERSDGRITFDEFLAEHIGATAGRTAHTRSAVLPLQTRAVNPPSLTETPARQLQTIRST